MEDHLRAVLEYVRNGDLVTTQDLVNAHISKFLGNAAGRLKELWDLGLVRRKEARSPHGHKSFAYSYYHPMLDYLPHFKPNLGYEHYAPPRISICEFEFPVA